MGHSFVLENLKSATKPDTYYRLDFVLGVYLDTKYEPDMHFKSILINFSEYSDWYQADLSRIKGIYSRDRFKDKIHIRDNEYEVVVPDSDGGTVQVPIDITNQIVLKPGSVWCNGKLVWEPSESISISINSTSQNLTSLKKLKEIIPGGLPFIKSGYYSNLIELKDCLVSRGKGFSRVKVYIPVMEIIRYYFSGSRYFTTWLYNGGLEKNEFKKKFLYKYKFEPGRNNVYVWLRRKCRDSDAIMLARGVADRQALKAMKTIYSSLVGLVNYRNQKGMHQPLCCPITEIPFLSHSDMDVQGQWLPPDENGEFSYLVRSIDQCHKPLPYETIEIESPDSYSANANKPRKPSKPRNPDDESKDDDEPNLTHDERPNEEIPEKELDFYTDRFVGLANGGVIKKLKKLSEDEIALRAFQKEEEELEKADKASTLPGNYQKDNEVESWDFNIRTRESISVLERLTTTAMAIKNIVKNLEEYNARALPVGFVASQLPYGFYTFQKPVDKPKNYNWCYVDGRNRQALLVEISNGIDSVFVLEIEGKNGVGFALYVLSGEDFDSDSEARCMLQKIANCSANNMVEKVFKKYFSSLTTLKHTNSSDDSFEDRLGKAVREVFD